MAPRKRKSTGGNGDEAKPQGQDNTFRRVTRSMSSGGGPSESTHPKKERKPKKAKGKAKASTSASEEKKEDVSVEEGANDEAAPAEGSNGKTVIIEHCKQCNSFKTRAFQVRDGLQNGVPGIKVLLNPEKPRRGCFEIREEGGETFISLQGLKRPFKPMKDLDMDKVISDIIDKIK